MASFGFAGKPTTLSIQEYEILECIGLDEYELVSHSYVPNNECFRFLGQKLDLDRVVLAEKQILNTCRFLEVDRVIRTDLNSILKIRLKMDIVLVKGEDVHCIQIKSSEASALRYEEVFLGRPMNIYFPKDIERKKDKPDGIEHQYLAPGYAYLDPINGTDSIPLFLSELSSWLGFPIKKKYRDLFSLLSNYEKPVSVKVLQSVLKDRKVMETASQLSSVFKSIQVSNGYVQLIQEKERKKAVR